MAAVGRLTQLVFDCADAAALAAFWRTILDLGEPHGEPGWLTLDWEPVGRLSFQQVDDFRAPEWPGTTGDQQVHLDLLVDDLASAAQRVLDAGATALSDVQNPGPKGWQIFADPAGHPFCLVSVPE